MLVLSRKKGESIFIGEIKVKVTEIKGNRVTLAIDAPRDVVVMREEAVKQKEPDVATSRLKSARKEE